MRADRYAFDDRRRKKRDYRRLWITRLTGTLRGMGMQYSRFICGVARAGVKLNRKELSELAIHDPVVFGQIVDKARAAIAV